jgi:hypothetical protein
MGTSKRKNLSSSVDKVLTLSFLAVSMLFVALTLASLNNATAGAFVFAGRDANSENRITHPRGYNGAGGKLDVKVCIVPNTPNTSDMEQPVRNAIAYWNKRQPTTSNLREHLPGGIKNVDFESIFVHELGHCVGLAHPNLANESGLQKTDRNYTKSTKGENSHFDIAPGVDNEIGSADDLRGDDINLHWYRLDNNNPFSIASIIDTSTYARDKLLLPNADQFAANGDRDVSTIFNAKNSEAIMQQGARTGEIQRTLLHDDVATLRLAMSGIDENANTDDDYTLNLVYGGISNQNCDINVSFNDDKTGFAVCKTNAVLSTKHILPLSTNVFFNSGYNWHFNKNPQCSQTTELVADEWRMISMPCQLGISSPNTVEAVLGDNLTPGDYDTRWVLYEYLPAGGYRKLALTDPLIEGKGYWIISLDDKTVDVLGEYPSTIDQPLGDDTSGGKWNLVGTPFRYDTAWADAQVIDTNGKVVTFNDTASDLIHDTAWRWNGSTYETLTLTSGNLSPFDGIWVYSKKAGTALRVPMSDAERTSSQ